MNYHLTEMLNAIYRCCDAYSNLMDVHFDEFTLRDVLKLDLIKYTLYLMSSDGKITNNESQFVKEYFDAYKTPQQLRELVDEWNVYSVEFESKAPQAMVIAVQIDNKLKIAGLAHNVSRELSSLFLECFESFGKEVMSIEGLINENAKRDYQIYIEMLNNYIQNNSVDYSVPVPKKRL